MSIKKTKSRGPFRSKATERLISMLENAGFYEKSEIMKELAIRPDGEISLLRKKLREMSYQDLIKESVMADDATRKAIDAEHSRRHALFMRKSSHAQALSLSDRLVIAGMSDEDLLSKIRSAKDERVGAILHEEMRQRRQAISEIQRKKGSVYKNPSHPVDDSASSSLTPVKHDPLGHALDALGRYRPNYKKPVALPVSHQPANPDQSPKKPATIQKNGTFSPEVERIEVTAKRIKRDGTFRDRVLGTYGTACIICGYSVHVEAAHLDPKHQVSDDRTENGAPLCRNHHWELDNGHLTPAEVRRQRDGS